MAKLIHSITFIDKAFIDKLVKKNELAAKASFPSGR
jgi:hypothetical protein